MAARLGNDGAQLAPQRAIADVLDLARELDPAVPDFQRRKLGQAANTGAVFLDRGGGHRPRPLPRNVRRQRGDGDAGGEPLEVDGEIDVAQRLVEIVDVEQDVLFGCREHAEVHEVAIAARLQRNPRARLVAQILRHHRGGFITVGRLPGHRLEDNRF